MGNAEATINDDGTITEINPDQETQEETESNLEETDVDDSEDTEKEDDNPEEEKEVEKPSTEQDIQKQIETQKQSNEDLKGILTDKGIDHTKLINEIETNGKLSAQSYQELEKGGFSRTMVDNFIAGQNAIHEKFAQAIYSYAGGEDKYTQVSQLIQAKGTEAVNSYNKLVDDGNLPAIQLFIKGIMAEHTAKNGTTNKTILGGGAPSQPKGYETTADMQKAMSDPRYGTNEKYTQQVQNKLAKSSFISIG